MFNCFLDADDHDAMLDLLQAFFNHRPPVFDNHYILRYLSTTVCSKKDGVALKRIIAFSRENGLRHAMFSDDDLPPSILASKCGNLSAVIALQDDGTFDSLSRDMATGLNSAQFAIINGHDHVLQHIMYEFKTILRLFSRREITPNCNNQVAARRVCNHLQHVVLRRLQPALAGAHAHMTTSYPHTRPNVCSAPMPLATTVL